MSPPQPAAPPARSPTARVSIALALVLVVAALARLAVAFGEDSIFWPDEIFQSLEPAHYRAFGYALLPWEFAAGARSWLLPLLLAPLMRAGAYLGGDNPRVYLQLIRVAFVAVSVATAQGVYLLSRRLNATPFAAIAATALFALSPPAIFFAPRAFSENVAALPVVFAIALLCSDELRARSLLIAGSLLGLGTMFRIQDALFCLAVLAWLAARRRWRPLAILAAVLLAWALIDGAFDRLTWGSWFQSARVYLRANLIGGYSNMFGREPPTYYLRAMVSSSGVAGVALMLLALVGATRARGVAFVAGLYLVAHSFTTLKQLRFAMVALPLLCALAAVGLDELTRIKRQLTVAVGVLAVSAAVVAAARLPRLTFAAFGANYWVTLPMWDHNGSSNRALLEARSKSDLCGLRLPAERTSSAGISWLHRRVPVYGADDAPPLSQHHYNYTIEVARDGAASLKPLGFSDCVPDPRFHWRAN